MKSLKIKKRLRVLVTALGGELGQAIAKSLRLGDRPYHIVGSDVVANGIAGVFAQEFQLVPYANDKDYIPSLIRLCKERKIDCVIPANDREIEVLSAAFPRRRLPNGAKLICLARDSYRVMNDKLACMKALQGRVPLVPFADGTDKNEVAQVIEEAGFPLIVKERKSSGSKGLAVVKNWRQLTGALKKATLPLVQGYIDDDQGEFSVGVFAHKGFLKAVCFKRKLGEGVFSSSWFAELNADREVLDYSLQVAGVIPFQGSINVQVRKSSAGVRLLEINPRFSSLAAARAACGFRDVDWSVDAALGEFDPKIKVTIEPIRFHRFISELIDFGNGYEVIPQWYPSTG